jgi:acyl-ACP thioesterase
VKAPPFTELSPPPAGARHFSLPFRAGLGDCAPTGRLRLDALVRWLQDVAYADVEDAGLAAEAFWALRRNRIVVRRWPRLAQTFTVTTFCSGLGRMWAERRTVLVPAAPASTVDREHGAAPVAESVALWVHLDPVTRRPVPFSQPELAAYGDPLAGRRISARLRHPAPDQAQRATPAGIWRFRAVDCDIADHVNNSTYWQPLEEELITAGPDPERLDAEIEFRAGAQPGDVSLLADGPMRWLLNGSGEVVASLAVAAPVMVDRAVSAPPGD